MKKILLSVVFILSFVSVFADGGGTVVIPSRDNGHPTVSDDGGTKPDLNGESDLVILSEYFAKDNNAVYAVDESGKSWEKISGADPKTFHVLAGQFSADSQHIYQLEKILPEANMATFSVISGEYGYAEDGKYVYGPYGIIAGADPATFVLETRHYAIDGGRVYFDTKPIEADAGSFKVYDGTLYARDNAYVYYAGEVIPELIPGKVVIQDNRLTTDEGIVYIDGKLDETATKEYRSMPSWLAWMAPYKMYLSGEHILFWVIVDLAILTLFVVVFGFFSSRYAGREESFLGTLLRAIVGALAGFFVAGLLASFMAHWLAIVLGILIGLIVFIVLWGLVNFAGRLLVALLALVALIVSIGIVGVALRSFFENNFEMLNWAITPEVKRNVVLLVTSLIAGTWLIMTQLRSTFFRSIGQSAAAAIPAFVVLALMDKVAQFSIVTMVLLMSLFYSAILWIMRFRNAHDLFPETVRVIRVLILLGLIMGVVVWIVL